MARLFSKLRRRFKSLFRQNRALLQILLIFGTCGIVVWCVYALLKTFQGTSEDPELWRSFGTSDAATDTVDPFQRDLAIELPEGQSPRIGAILDRCLQAYNLDHQKSEDLVTLRRIGKLTLYIPSSEADAPQTSVSVEATFFWKDPDLIRYSLTFQDRTQRFTYNGTMVWSTISQNGRILASAEVTDEERVRFMRNAVMSQPEIRTLQQRDSISLVGTAEVRGRACYHLRLARIGYSLEWYVDQHNFLCLRQRRVDESFEEPPRETVVDLDDFRVQEGRVFPFFQTVTLDGQKNSEFVIERFDLNPGIVSSAFDPPPSENLPSSSP